MPNPSSLTTLQAEILAIDARNDRDNQRIADIRAGQDARQKTRDELAAQIIRAMKASEVSGDYIDGPQRTIWWLTSGKLRYESVVSGAAISIPTVAPAPSPVPATVSAPAPATPTTALSFPANDQTIESAEFGPKATQPFIVDLVGFQLANRLTKDSLAGAVEFRVKANGMLVDVILGMRLRGRSRNAIVREHVPLTIADILACEELHYARGGKVEDFWPDDGDGIISTKDDKGSESGKGNATGNGIPTEVTTS